MKIVSPRSSWEKPWTILLLRLREPPDTLRLLHNPMLSIKNQHVCTLRIGELVFTPVSAFQMAALKHPETNDVRGLHQL